MAATNRQYRKFERPWLTEYLSGRYKHVVFEYEKPVILPPASDLVRPGDHVSPAYGGVKIARLDAYHLWPDHQTIWEARRNPQVGVIEQVQRYARLWAASALGQASASLPIHLHLLVDRDNAMLRAEALAAGIEWAIYLPTWLASEEAATADKQAAYNLAQAKKRRGLI